MKTRYDLDEYSRIPTYSGSDLYGMRSGKQELDGVLHRRYPTDPDDRKLHFLITAMRLMSPNRESTILFS